MNLEALFNETPINLVLLQVVLKVLLSKALSVLALTEEALPSVDILY